MKRVVFAAVAVLALSTTAVLAGEGNNEPFEFKTPGVTRAAPFAAGQNQGTRVYSWSGEQAGASPLVQPTSSEAGVQTANSLPLGFSGRGYVQPASNLANARHPVPMHLAIDRVAGPAKQG